MKRKKIIIEAFIAFLVIAVTLWITAPRFLCVQIKRQILQRQREIQAIADAAMQYELDNYPNGMHEAPNYHNSAGWDTLQALDFERIKIQQPDYPVTFMYEYVNVRSTNLSETPTDVPSHNITFAVGASKPPSNLEPKPNRQNASVKRSNRSILDFFSSYDISNGLHSEGDFIVGWSYHSTGRQGQGEASP